VLSTIVSLQVCAAIAVGVNVTLAEQVAPGASVAGGAGQVLARARSPLVTLLVGTGKGDALVAVTGRGGLVVPTVRRGNFRLVGEKVRLLQAPAAPAL
jgi:hypothetical protein